MGSQPDCRPRGAGDDRAKPAPGGRRAAPAQPSAAPPPTSTPRAPNSRLAVASAALGWLSVLTACLPNRTAVARRLLELMREDPVPDAPMEDKAVRAQARYDAEREGGGAGDNVLTR